MGGLVMVVLHLAALWFAPVLLFVTIPLHMVLTVLTSRSKAVADAEAPTPQTHVRCPDCRELVRKDARRCKHCGIGLTPIED